MRMRRGTRHSRGLYQVFRNMIERCHNPNVKRYKDYGGRGISVCEEWRGSWKLFHDWAVSSGYNSDLKLDRIDNNGNYEPSNCKWSDNLSQANNKRNNRFITFRGETKTLMQWARETGIRRERIADRLRYGWSVDRALTEKPILGRNQHFYVVRSIDDVKASLEQVGFPLGRAI